MSLYQTLFFLQCKKYHPVMINSNQRVYGKGQGKGWEKGVEKGVEKGPSPQGMKRCSTLKLSRNSLQISIVNLLNVVKIVLNAIFN